MTKRVVLFKKNREGIKETSNFMGRPENVEKIYIR